MKRLRHKKALAFALVAVVAAVMLAGAASEYGAVSEAATAEADAYVDRQKNGDESGFTQIEPAAGGTVTLENDRLTLTLYTDTTRFVVTDKRTGAAYASYPEQSPNMLSEEDIARAASNVGVIYYDADSKIHHMGSGTDAVQKGQYTLWRKDDVLRILYTVGSASDGTIAPAFLTQETMEETVLPNLRASEKARLKLYYKLCSPEATENGYDDYVKAQPALKGKAFYALTDDVTEQILADITALFEKAGLDAAAAAADMASLGATQSASALPAGFLIPLELSLEGDGFTARILSDRITENNTTDRLTDVFLLEHFGACGAEGKGSFLVPDGSGALIALNTPSPSSYAQHFYNSDPLIVSDEQGQLSRDVPLPYFGRFDGQGGYLATVEGAAAVGTLTARTMGGANPQNAIGVSFRLRAFDQTDIGQNRSIPTLNVYTQQLAAVSPAIRYTLLDGGDAPLTQCAEILRDRFGLTGEVDGGDVPLYLDFVCLTEKTVDVVGISVKRTVVLSTLSEIGEVVQRLQEAGLKDLRVRLRGWTEQGLSHSAFDRCRLSKKVGTEEELASLAGLLQSGGGALYLDTDFGFAQKNASFDRLHLARDVSRGLERSVASLRQYDPVTLRRTSTMEEGYVISPLSYLPFAERFLSGYIGSYAGCGLSWAQGGAFLSGNYDTDHEMDADQAAAASGRIFALLAEKSGGRVLTDYGYAYALTYVTDVINAPLTCSWFLSETQSVPLLQMTLSGTRGYTGPALNLTGTRTAIGDMAASAAAPYYLLMTRGDDLLRDTGLQGKWYSLDYRKHIDDLIATCTAYQQTVAAVYGKTIVGYDVPQDNVSVTQFSGGERLAVNRGAAPVTVEGTEIAAYGYALLK